MGARAASPARLCTAGSGTVAPIKSVIISKFTIAMLSAVEEGTETSASSDSSSEAARAAAAAARRTAFILKGNTQPYTDIPMRTTRASGAANGVCVCVCVGVCVGVCVRICTRL